MYTAGLALRHWRRWCITGLLCLSVGYFSPPVRAVGVNPHLRWQTLESAHFRITFAQGHAALAQHTLVIAESVRAELDPRFEWSPAGKVELVLADYMDMPNGLTYALPYNHIEFFLSPPDRLGYTLEDYDAWLRLLLAHEYTHVLQLDKASYLPKWLRYGFGRFPLLFPGNYQPSMYLEGLAVLDETDAASGVGRGQSAQYAMMMRAEVDHGIRPYDQVTMSGVTEWPAGELPYLYGVNFYQFIAHQYGEHAIFELVQNYSHQIVPFLVNMNVDHVLGENIRTVWQQFGQYLQARYGATPGVQPGEALVQGAQLTHYGYRTRSPVAAGDGSVYFIRDNGVRTPAVMRWNNGVIRHVADIFATPARLHWNRYSGLLLARPEVCHDYDYYFDLYRIDPVSGSVRRLTHCGRYHHAAWSPDGARIAASRIVGARSSLVLLTADGKRVEVLWQARDDTVLGDLDWSPDGARLAAALWRPGRGWAIELFDLQTRRWHALAIQKDANDPRFSPDGDSVLFTSAQGGVFNLRRVAVDGSHLVTLTRVRTGAFAPTQSANGDLFYIGYSAAGFDLHRLKAGNALALPGTMEMGGGKPLPVTAKTVEPGVIHAYSPWSSMRPRYWFPEFAVGPDQFMAGALTSGQDSLGVQTYAADINHEFHHNLTGGSLLYTYSDRFQLGLGRGYQYFDSSGAKSLDRIRRDDEAEFMYSNPLLSSTEHALIISGGLHREHDTNVYLNTGLTPVPVASPTYDETVAGVRLVWSNAHYWPVSIGPNDGRHVQLLAETGHRLPGDFPGNAYRLDWREYVRTGDEASLMVRYTEGYTTTDARAFYLGGSSDTGTGTLLQNFVFGQRGFALHGYRSGEFIGHRMRIEGLTWNLPIAHPERAFTTVPFGSHQLYGRVFVERGAAWDRGGAPQRYYNSYGLELDADLNLLYIINFNFGVGVARGTSAGGETQGYARLTLPY